MQKNLLYMHSGSGNHGCEALVRTVGALLDDPVSVFTRSPEQDERYIKGDSFTFIHTGQIPSKSTVDGVLTRVRMKVLGQKYAFVKPSYKTLIDAADSSTVAFSIGGDNYCYDGMPEVLAILNRELNHKGATTCLYGCSIEPSLLDDDSVLADLHRYSLIVARESITFGALREHGLENCLLVPDAAFTLETLRREDVDRVVGSNAVGINLSPLVLENDNKILFEAYNKLIEWILTSTDMDVVLIPHVVWDGNNDMVPLKQLHDVFSGSGRVRLVGDCSAPELKGYIAKCRFFVGARTHATIAAYSSNVPTLAVGYSVKSRGIAKDLFGRIEDYVVDGTSMRDDQQLVRSFKWLVDNEASVRSHLVDTIPSYVDRATDARKIINGLRK